MKTFLAVIGGICLVCFIWATLGWGGRVSDYNQSVSTETIKTLLASRGLDVCRETTLRFEETPGFVEGKAASVSSHCNLDLNPMRIAILKFDSEASRDAAIQRAKSTHRGGYGPNLAYSYGPYVITLQGSRGIGDQLLLGKILSEAGANP